MIPTKRFARPPRTRLRCCKLLQSESCSNGAAFFLACCQFATGSLVQVGTAGYKPAARCRVDTTRPPTPLNHRRGQRHIHAVAMTTANKVTIFRILLVPFFIAQVIYYVKTGNEL